jgi:hypothetical protein
VVIDWTGFQVSDFRFDLSWTLLLTRAHANVEWRDQILAGYERLRGAVVENIEIFEVFACTRRLFNLTISLSLGPERMGMRLGAVELMRQQALASQRVYELMQQRTGIRIPRVERVLEVNP